MTVSEVMTPRPIHVGLDMSLRSVRSMFATHGFHHLIVTGGREVVGVVSDRDVLRHLSPFVGSLSEEDRDRRVLDKRVHQIMTRRPVLVRELTTLVDASRLMLDLKVSCLPVVGREKQPVGILTSRDVLRWTLTRLHERGGVIPVADAA